MKVYIAVGHGIQPDGTFDPGAVSGKVTEQTSGDVIVRKAARLCRAAGLTVMDESFSDDPNYVGTAAAANKWGADALVSVHHDWTGGLQAHGFWYPGSTKGERLCREIIAEMKAGGVTVDDRHVRERDLYVLRKTAMPATLIEVGRVGQAEIDTDAERLAMGRYIAEGIADYAGVTIPAPKPEPTPTTPAPDGDAEWKYPEHAQALLDRGVYSKWTGPGHNVDTDNLSAYLDRLADYYDARLAALQARVDAAEAAAAAATKAAGQATDGADVDVDAIVAASVEASLEAHEALLAGRDT